MYSQVAGRLASEKMIRACTLSAAVIVYAWSQPENTGFRKRKYDILLIYVPGDRVEN
jgi:hypothetical protein